MRHSYLTLMDNADIKKKKSLHNLNNCIKNQKNDCAQPLHIFSTIISMDVLNKVALYLSK